jgi:uncharacterized Zn finger protein
MTKISSYYEFYKRVCEDFNFPVDETMKYNVLYLIGHNNLSVGVMKDFVDKNIAVGQKNDRKKYDQLRQYVKKLYGKTIRDYRKDLGMKQKNR